MRRGMKFTEQERLNVKLNSFWEDYFELTGEVRPPKKGEWMVNSNGIPVIADFDFEECSFPIAKEKTGKEEKG